MSEQQEAELAVLREDAAELWNMLAELTGECRQREGGSLERIERKAEEALRVLNARCYGNIEEYPGFVIYTGPDAVDTSPCTVAGEHLKGQRHRWQECPTYHDDEG